jgi:glucose/arabinose dehydrogenase
MQTTRVFSFVIILATIYLSTSCNGKTEEKNDLQSNSSLSKEDISDAKADVKLEKIKLPENFTIEVWAAKVPNARSLAISEKGIVFVGNRQDKKVYALVDENQDGKADTKYTLTDGLNMPNGVAYRDGDLYVAEVNRILRFKDIENNLNNPSYDVVYDQYPSENHHGWKFIAFGPDGMLYVPVGAPCNICEPEKEIFASITRIDVKSPNPQPEIYAHGVRNTVGFDWHPVTGEMWFTDNGRDMLGDDTPDCELNRITAKGQHFGYPYWHAGDVKDPEFGSEGKAQADYIQPAAKLGAHVAPLGMRFYEGEMFPSSFKNQIFIAKHGSWNRTQKSGYEISLASVDTAGEVTELSVFATGWLDETTQKAWGRPVDLQELPDGSVLISDDMAGVIYRITYSPSK